MTKWRQRIRKVADTKSSPSDTNTKKYRFQIVPLWRASSKSVVFVDLFMRISVDGRRIRNNKVAFFKFIRHSVDGASDLLFCLTLFFFCFWTLNKINCFKKYEYCKSHFSLALFNFPNVFCDYSEVSCCCFLAQLVKPVLLTRLRSSGHEATAWTARALIWRQIWSLKLRELPILGVKFSKFPR